MLFFVTYYQNYYRVDVYISVKTFIMGVVIGMGLITQTGDRDEDRYQKPHHEKGTQSRLYPDFVSPQKRHLYRLDLQGRHEVDPCTVPRVG